MKIGAILTCYLPSLAYGGPVQSRTQGFHELIRRGHEVTVLTSNVVDLDPFRSTSIWLEDIDGVRVRRFPSAAPVKHFAGIISIPLLKWLREYAGQFDVFHISYARELIPITAMRTLDQLGARVLLQTHGMLDRTDGPRALLDRWITDRQLLRASGVIVLQEHEENEIQRRNPHITTSIIPNGINLDDPIPAWTGASNPQVILFLARIHPRKNVLGFLQAAKLMHDQDPGLNFRIVGPDGGEKEAAVRMAADLGISGAVAFVDAVPRHEALLELSRASVYVLPSDNEPFATTVTEALAIGTPIVITNSHQNRGMIERFHAAEVFNAGPENMASAIRKILSDPQHARYLSENGRALVKHELDIRKTVDRLEGLYREIAAREIE